MTPSRDLSEALTGEVMVSRWDHDLLVEFLADVREDTEGNLYIHDVVPVTTTRLERA